MAQDVDEPDKTVHLATERAMHLGGRLAVEPAGVFEPGAVDHATKRTSRCAGGGERVAERLRVIDPTDVVRDLDAAGLQGREIPPHLDHAGDGVPRLVRLPPAGPRANHDVTLEGLECAGVEPLPGLVPGRRRAQEHEPQPESDGKPPRDLRGDAARTAGHEPLPAR